MLLCQGWRQQGGSHLRQYIFSVYEPDASSFVVLQAVCQTGGKNISIHYIPQNCKIDVDRQIDVILPGKSCDVTQCVEDSEKLDSIWEEKQCWTLLKQHHSLWKLCRMLQHLNFKRNCKTKMLNKSWNITGFKVNISCYSFLEKKRKQSRKTVGYPVFLLKNNGLPLVPKHYMFFFLRITAWMVLQRVHFSDHIQ